MLAFGLQAAGFFEPALRIASWKTAAADPWGRRLRRDQAKLKQRRQAAVRAAGAVKRETEAGTAARLLEGIP